MKVQHTGEINHNQTQCEKRPMKGENRKEAAKDLQDSGVNNWYYQKVTGMKTEELDAGNLTACSTREALRKILSEDRGLSNLHDCVLQEIRIMQELYKDIHPSAMYTDGGFIQYFAVKPFKIHLFTDEQVQLYLDAFKTGPVTLYLDATGSLINKVPGQPKHIFYYVLLLANPREGTSGIPVAEMLSNDQHSCEVWHMLARFLNAASRHRHKLSVIPQTIITDFSWAMVQAVLTAFNSEDVKMYLEEHGRL